MTRRRAIRFGVILVAVAGLATAYFVWWRPPPPAEQLRTGRAALAAGDNATAAKIAESLSAKYPDHARILKADIQLQQGDPKNALFHLNKVEDKGELRREAAALAGRCLLQLQNLPEAERAFQFVLSEQPDNIDGHRGLAAVYYDQGALLKCLHHLGEVARLDPMDARPHRMMGYIHTDLEARPEAIENYRAALARSLNPTAASEVREELAEQLVKLGQPAAALETLGQVAGGESPRGTAARAEAEWSLGRTADAVTRLDAAIKTHPESLPLLRLRGKLYAEAGEWEHAAAMLERAVKADATDLISLHHLAMAYERLKRPADAERIRKQHETTKESLGTLTTLNREADARPWDPGVRLKLADVCESLGKPQLAAMWRRAAEAGAVRSGNVP
ncbi:MAG: tetratricopeptide repeat protein [Planctomycetes bacterium]|nr:tetratricopeptide repeat protein [Planctomycetota bacterium]